MKTFHDTSGAQTDRTVKRLSQEAIDRFINKSLLMRASRPKGADLSYLEAPKTERRVNTADDPTTQAYKRGQSIYKVLDITTNDFFKVLENTQTKIRIDPENPTEEDLLDFNQKQ
jgi:hypothetical protein